MSPAMPSPKAASCPSCKRAVLAPPANPCFPFCSERCRTIDLGRWLGESYRVPVRNEDEDDDGTATPAAPRLPDA